MSDNLKVKIFPKQWNPWKQEIKALIEILIFYDLDYQNSLIYVPLLICVKTKQTQLIQII